MNLNRDVSKKLCIFIISVVVVILSIFKMQYYVENTGGFHDLPMHLGYLVYVDENESMLIPEFRDIRGLALKSENDYKDIHIFSDDVNTEWTMSSDLNYLGHPPLYYEIVSWFNPINYEGNIITFDMNKISIINMVMVGIGLILILYIGILLKLNPPQFFFYSVMSTSIPLFTYLGGVLNNDNLGYIGVSLIIISLIYINQNKRRFIDYLLMALGLFICMMTKLTFGLTGVIILSLYFAYTIYKEKSISILINKRFLLTLPIYLLIVIYYCSILFKYHTIQPSLQKLDFDYYKKTTFYIDPSNRLILNIFEYGKHYLMEFCSTWMDIRSHSLVRVHSNAEGVLYIIILISPFLYLAYGLVFRRKFSENSKLVTFGCVSILVSIIIQFFMAASNFYNSGYLGGTQSRYYVADTFIMCLAFIYWLESINWDKIKRIKDIIYIILPIIAIVSDIKFFIS